MFKNTEEINLEGSFGMILVGSGYSDVPVISVKYTKLGNGWVTTCD